MWSAISKFFTKTNANTSKDSLSSDENNMERSEEQRRKSIVHDTEPQDTYDTRQSKQRASVKWLLSKAYNNRVPENLREPFYRDQEDQEHLKPHIVHTLANAELYCLALANIYSDPNYHNLNHWGIIQALARKGVFVAEPPDAQLTETVLIQTTPIKMNAHMAVIEAMMQLYAKEVVTPDRVVAAVQRFSHRSTALSELPVSYEEGLLLWVNQSCTALKQKIEQEMEQTDKGEGDRTRCPDLPEIREFKDLCDGIGLAALISFYCPEEIHWKEVVVNYIPTVSDSVHNMMLVQNFSQNSLPHSVFHMMPEDVTYMRSSMKQNLIVFLADLFNVLEIHPVKCVRFPGSDRMHLKEVYPRNSQGVAHKRSFQQSISPIPDLRSNLASYSGSFTVSMAKPSPNAPSLKRTHSLHHPESHAKSSAEQGTSEERLPNESQDEFVVHRGRSVPTLSNLSSSAPHDVDEPLIPARLRPAKEKMNHDSKAEERGEEHRTDLPAAGRPSNWEERKTTYAGRRSRRNSISDDSQLTIENFGGSQENLHMIGRNPDKEPAVHIGRKVSSGDVRTSALDTRGSGVEQVFDSRDFDGREKFDEEKLMFEEKLLVKLQDAIPGAAKHIHSKETEMYNDLEVDLGKATSFAELSRIREQGNKGINIVYMQHDRDQEGGGNLPSKSSFLTKKGKEKTTTFATLPNTTTWQQQSTNQQQQEELTCATDESNPNNHVMASQLHNIRMKLEEKRRRIESEKVKMEVVMSRQRQKVGKAAFLQAVSKGKGSYMKTPESDDGKDTNGEMVEPTMKPQRPFTLQVQHEVEGLSRISEITEDARSVEHKWLDGSAPFVEERKTPDIENMDMEQYQQSIAKMNTSLHEIQADIQRLANQQQQIQTIVSGSENHQRIQMAPTSSISTSLSGDQQQFYLHEQNQRRTWSQPQMPQPQMHHPHIEDYNQQHGPADRRVPWGDTLVTSRHQPTNHNFSQPIYTSQQGGFVLHPQNDKSMGYPQHTQTMGDMRHHNGDQGAHHHSLGMESALFQQEYQAPNQIVNNIGYPGPGVQHMSFQLQQGPSHAPPMYPQTSTSTPPSMLSVTSSPQHKNVHRINQLMVEAEKPGLSNQYPVQSSERTVPTQCKVSGQQTAPRQAAGYGVMHAPIPTPPVDDMEPQSISFIDMPNQKKDEQALLQGIQRLQITSGSRTYRIPSPTRPAINRTFQVSPEQASHKLSSEVSPETGTDAKPEHLKDGMNAEKGFYISFDDDVAPKRPKPQLRVRKSSPKKEKLQSITPVKMDDQNDYIHPSTPPSIEKEMFETDPDVPLEEMAPLAAAKDEEAPVAGVGLVIGTELVHPDPNALDEMEKKKERIMLLSLQRRQQQEELKQQKEQEAQRRKELEKLKEEEKQRKKEEEKMRRQQILEQYKLKKAMEEAEREGKQFDISDHGSAKLVPKMRNKTSTTSRPRPKTIHVDSSGDMQEGMLTPSRGKKGSSSNLTDNVFSPRMRQDYYRGSQDSLADGYNDRRMSGMFRATDSPDDGRGSSPCRSLSQLGRRGSYRASRDPPDTSHMRSRSKYSTYQTNFRGRKSNSLMNLCGSSSDQDSMVYRYTDTDSGLGRATPPRRAPSPGMGTVRHLPSPSGPGSLPPGLTSKRRGFDDGASDISSTPSSMMEYTGPRLYKQPATKSNRGIMLNAVEYCVFPGAVNKEAKRRVLEEIARSESKHFLILFRDAGCQFRALYSYNPEREEVVKLYGTGPKQVNDRMYDKFFKYNSGGKCFSQVHTKHLTVTIDAFTIHNSLWQGKKVNLPNKKDMALVI